MSVSDERSSIAPAMLVSPVDYSANATCKHCGYALFGLPEQRCPECGQTFNWSDPTTMNVPGWKPPAKPFPYSFGQCALCAGFVATGLVLLPVGDGDATLWGLGYYIWGIVLVGWVIAAAQSRFVPSQRPWNANKPAWWRRGVLAMLIATFVLGIRITKCPHATRLFVGPFPILIQGRPCNNGQRFRSIYVYIFDRSG
jgi:hypothetical protein